MFIEPLLWWSITPIHCKWMIPPHIQFQETSSTHNLRNNTWSQCFELTIWLFNLISGVTENRCERLVWKISFFVYGILNEGILIELCFHSDSICYSKFWCGLSFENGNNWLYPFGNSNAVVEVTKHMMVAMHCAIHS